jgi:hypothetical protein
MVLTIPTNGIFMTFCPFQIVPRCKQHAAKQRLPFDPKAAMDHRSTNAWQTVDCDELHSRPPSPD